MLDQIITSSSVMAQRMRQLDWSQTVLGPMAQWPQPLRTSVGICLDCAFPIVVWWGPELAILYNDEYRAILGPQKDPHALGERGARVWAEIWDVIGPMLAQVVRSGRATRSRDLLLHIDRQGYPEEAYFSFSYSPIYDEDGRVGGIFCPVIETTEKVIGERRLRTLRDLADRCKGADCEATVYRAAANVLAGNPRDVPFALIYRVDAGVARLDASAGIPHGHPAAPATVVLDDDRTPWPLAAVARSGHPALVSDLARSWPGLPTGAWKAPSQTALALPVQLPGQEQPRAILVAAVSPMRSLDEDYRTFFGLVATQIASGLADAQALEAERRRSEALAEIDRAKTAFFSNISHEFRTPLTLMLGPLEDALGELHGVLSEPLASSLAVAHRNSLRLLKLVNTLLEFSRIEAGRVEASYEPTDLAALTAELASVFRSATDKAGLSLTVDCPPLPEHAYVDRDMWEKVVLNLLSNAFKFTFDGGIVVALRQRGDRFELTVRDSGVGIPAIELPRLFQRFHRVKNARSRTHEGSGIGLAFVQELIKLHGGEVAVASIEGGGTTFTASIPVGCAHLPADRIGTERRLSRTGTGALPFIEEALRWLPDAAALGSDADAVADLTAAGPMPTPPVARRRIVIADDNADMRDYLRRLLEPLYDVTAFADGRQALQHLRAHGADLVLTDVMMPGVDGFGLLAALRADEALRTLPVVMLSARAGEEARIEGLNAGADDYVTKPFSARELLARVGSQVEMARLRHDAERALREADRRKDEFLAVLAHELRNPLAPIRNGLELMKLAGADSETATRARVLMQRQVEQLVRLVDDLLDVSRISRGMVSLRKARVALSAVVRSAVENSRLLIESSGHLLTIAVPPEPIYLDADELRLSQVLTNLLNNAAKYTDRGGRIRLSVEVRDGHAVITVADNGRGIPAHMLGRVFEMFTRVEGAEVRWQPGLGVGLAIAKQLVEMHGGTIEARSGGHGMGSELIVRVPVVLSLVADAPVAPADAAEAPLRRRVLVVDDNADAAYSMAMMLEVMGCETRTASDGLEALALARTFAPEVMLLDIGMPRMDGHETCRRLRQQPWGAGITVVALTGQSQEVDKRSTREAGFDLHLVKPADPSTLRSLLAGARTMAA